VIVVALAAVASACGGGDDEQTSGLSGTALTQLTAAAREQQAELQRTSDAKVTVPTIAGQPYTRARHEVERAGLEFGGRYPGTLGNPDLPTRCLIVDSQSPAPGTTMTKGSQVVGTIGVCPEKIPGLSRRSPYEP
jgi:beta-lactam-binding protein with PASTA domain